MKDFYWNIRPKPQCGTVEWRVRDTLLSVERAAALAAFLQALCRMLLERSEPPPRQDDYLVYNDNRFQTFRFDLDGFLIHPQSNEPLSLRKNIRATLVRLTSHGVALGSEAAFDALQFAAAGGGNNSSVPRQTDARDGSSQSMVEFAMSQFRSQGAA